MIKKIAVGVLFGGRSGEHEVSLQSAESVMNALDLSKYDVIPIGITKTGQWIEGTEAMEKLKTIANKSLLPQKTPLESPVSRKQEDQSLTADSAELLPAKRILDLIDVFFPVLHGTYGEDGTIQGMLEIAQKPYVGCNVMASAVAMDKIVFKKICLAEGIPSVPFLSINRRDLSANMDQILEQVESILDFPVFTKPANLGSSVGISLCKDKNSLSKGLLEAALFDRRIIVEKGVDSVRELEVSVLGYPDFNASVPGEVIPSRDFYDYQAKYLDDNDDASRLIIPADIPVGIADQCRQYAIKAFRAIDGSGMARVDFLLDQNKQMLYLNEINTIPGFTHISMYPKLWEASGIAYSELLDLLIQQAISRFEDIQQNQTAYSR